MNKSKLAIILLITGVCLFVVPHVQAWCCIDDCYDDFVPPQSTGECCEADYACDPVTPPPGGEPTPPPGGGGSPMWYCVTKTETYVPLDTWYCTTTSSNYEQSDDGKAVCQTNLGIFIPDRTTGVCYLAVPSELSICQSECIRPTSTPTPTPTPFCTVTSNASCTTSGTQISTIWDVTSSSFSINQIQGRFNAPLSGDWPTVRRPVVTVGASIIRNHCGQCHSGSSIQHKCRSV